MKTMPQPLFDTYKTFMAVCDAENERSAEREYTAERPAIAEYLSSFPADIPTTSDYAHVRGFLRAYNGLETTFRSYRTQVERLMLWSWIEAQKSVIDLNRTDAERFMEFCLRPHPEWIGRSVRHRFLKQGEIHEPNPDWRPFTIQAKKAVSRSIAEGQMQKTETDCFKMEQGSVRQVFTICSSFFDWLAANGVESFNPFRAIKQKSKYIAREEQIVQGRALSKLQWEFVLETAEKMAAEDPRRHERTLFILVTLFSMYLRVSDIVGNPRWTPTMGSFHKVAGNWLLRVNGKGNKTADISVRPDYLNYLMRYRKHRNLPPLPMLKENTPLLVKLNGDPGLTDRHVRAILQEVFDRALEQMQRDGFEEGEIKELREASLHWLRHTSATMDAPHRAEKHLQADLRHEQLSTTQNIYYNVDNQERAHSIAGLKIKR